jgi:biotin carboxyl carrier protein
LEIDRAQRGVAFVKINIVAAGRTHAVEVDAGGDKQPFVVTVDGHPHEVSVSEIGGVLSLLVGSAEAGPHTQYKETGVSRPAKSYEVTLAPGVVHVDGVPVEVEIARPMARRGGQGPHDHAGPQKIAAPMPGKIVKVLVRAGDRVEPRQGLVVVEAMKMENELRSRAAGTVTEVRAIEGSSVDAGAILIVVE